MLYAMYATVAGDHNHHVYSNSRAGHHRSGTNHAERHSLSVHFHSDIEGVKQRSCYLVKGLIIYDQ